MRLLILVFSILSFFVTNTFAGAYDGQYSGYRFVGAKSNHPDKCSPTTISGRIKGSSIELTLTYNGSVLKGNITKSGSIRLRGETPNGTYLYKFQGRIRGKTLKGTWKTSPPDCAGTWTVKKK